MKPIRLVELFAGIGSQAKALERLDIPHERTAVCEIDDKAYASYVAIHGETPNLGDITKVEKLPECDLLTYSFPCQDLSSRRQSEGHGQRERHSVKPAMGSWKAAPRRRETSAGVVNGKC